MIQAASFPYRLLVLDIDGTLLDDQNRITESTLNALDFIQKYGVKIVLATGRLYPDAQYYACQLGISTPMILLHGALVQTHEGQILQGKRLSGHLLKELREIARNRKTSFQIYRKDSLLIESVSPWNEEYLKYSPCKPSIKQIPETMDVIQEEDVYQFAFLGEKKEILQIRKLVQTRLNGLVSLQCSHPHLLEIAAPGVSKGEALKWLSGILNIACSEIIAIGDYENDIDMIRMAGLGVAMGNAPGKVKEVADFITRSHHQDGIAYFISHLAKEFSLKDKA